MPELLSKFSDALTKPIHIQQALLTPEELEKLEEFLKTETAPHAGSEKPDVRRSYRLHDRIYNLGDPAEAIYFVLKGEVLNFEPRAENKFLALDRVPERG